jgi:MFS family permease
LSQALIVGQLIGSALAGGVMSAAGTENGGYRNAYIMFAGLAFVALLLAATLAPRTRERTNPLEEAAA